MWTAMSLPPWRDTTIVAYLDEPPFAISGQAGERPSGCDMDVALHVLTGAGVGDIRYVRTTFDELIPGVLDQRWHLTTAIFVTDDRAEVVDFSRPIWAMTDGFIVRRHDAARMTSYEAIAAAHATLAVVVGQVQRETAIGTHSVTQFVGSLDQVLT
jgi:polar amino acid transport system substrate-binding protein